MEGPRRRGGETHVEADYWSQQPRAREPTSVGYEGKPRSRACAVVTVLLLCGILLPSGGGGEAEGEDYAAHRITHEVLQPAEVFARLESGEKPSLRGCCGAPSEFLWVFLDGTADAVAGTPFRTRIFALDAKGRQAKPADCDALRVDLGLSGRARLLQAPPAWKLAALELDITNERAETVEAEMRIESPDPSLDVLLHTSQISFASGPVQQFQMLARPQHGLTGKRGPNAPWPTGFALDMVVSSQDQFGNRVRLDTPDLGRLMLRSNAAASDIEVIPADGSLNILAGSLEGTVHIKASQAGASEFWLEPVAKNVSTGVRADLRKRTSKTVTFTNAVNPNGPPPVEADKASLSAADAKWRHMAEKVKDSFRHAWGGYTRCAWGKDELEPKACKGKNPFGGIGMTIVDSLTTLWLMGLAEEFEKALAFVQNELDFAKADFEVSVFELVIRGVGGLAGAHALSGRQVFLDRSAELANRLLPAFNTSSRMPWPKWNIARGKGSHSSEPTILAEAGSCQLEFRYLSQQTGDHKYKDVADASFEAIQSGGMTGLLPVYLTSPDVKPVRSLASKFAFGALTDSYYEYLLKQWIQTPTDDYLKDKWIAVMDELPGLIRPRPSSSIQAGSASVPSYKLVEVAPGGEPIWKMDHLSCFTAGMISLGLNQLPASDLKIKERNNTWWIMAEGLTKSCVEMWTSSKSGLAPEFMSVHSKVPHDFKDVPRNGRHSFLRPETAESLFYMYRSTGDEKYRQWGEKLFNAILRHSETEAGYATVQDVNKIPTEHVDEMQSFVMAETLKYLYLLFSPSDRLDLDTYVLNTEAHPLLRPPRQQ